MTTTRGRAGQMLARYRDSLMRFHRRPDSGLMGLVLETNPTIRLSQPIRSVGSASGRIGARVAPRTTSTAARFRTTPTKVAKAGATIKGIGSKATKQTGRVEALSASASKLRSDLNKIQKLPASARLQASRKIENAARHVGTQAIRSGASPATVAKIKNVISGAETLSSQALKETVNRTVSGGLPGSSLTAGSKAADLGTRRTPSSSLLLTSEATLAPVTIEGGISEAEEYAEEEDYATAEEAYLDEDADSGWQSGGGGYGFMDEGNYLVDDYGDFDNIYLDELEDLENADFWTDLDNLSQELEQVQASAEEQPEPGFFSKVADTVRAHPVLTIGGAAVLGYFAWPRIQEVIER